MPALSHPRWPRDERIPRHRHRFSNLPSRWNWTLADVAPALSLFASAAPADAAVVAVASVAAAYDADDAARAPFAAAAR